MRAMAGQHRVIWSEQFEGLLIWEFGREWIVDHNLTQSHKVSAIYIYINVFFDL